MKVALLFLAVAAHAAIDISQIPANCLPICAPNAGDLLACQTGLGKTPQDKTVCQPLCPKFDDVLKCLECAPVLQSFVQPLKDLCQPAAPSSAAPAPSSAAPAPSSAAPSSEAPPPSSAAPPPSSAAPSSAAPSSAAPAPSSAAPPPACPPVSQPGVSSAAPTPSSAAPTPSSAAPTPSSAAPTLSSAAPSSEAPPPSSAGPASSAVSPKPSSGGKIDISQIPANCLPICAPNAGDLLACQAGLGKTPQDKTVCQPLCPKFDDVLKCLECAPVLQSFVNPLKELCQAPAPSSAAPSSAAPSSAAPSSAAPSSAAPSSAAPSSAAPASSSAAPPTPSGGGKIDISQIPANCLPICAPNAGDLLACQAGLGKSPQDKTVCQPLCPKFDDVLKCLECAPVLQSFVAPLKDLCKGAAPSSAAPSSAAPSSAAPSSAAPSSAAPSSAAPASSSAAPPTPSGGGKIDISQIPANCLPICAPNAGDLLSCQTGLGKSPQDKGACQPLCPKFDDVLKCLECAPVLQSFVAPLKDLCKAGPAPSGSSAAPTPTSSGGPKPTDPVMPDISKLSPCALQCVLGTLTSQKCKGPTDTACICTDGFINASSKCLAEKCPTLDTIPALDLTKKQCPNLPLPDLSGLDDCGKTCVLTSMPKAGCAGPLDRKCICGVRFPLTTSTCLLKQCGLGALPPALKLQFRSCKATDKSECGDSGLFALFSPKCWLPFKRDMSSIHDRRGTVAAAAARRRL